MDEGGGNVAEPVQVTTLLEQARARGLARLDAELLLAALLRAPRSRLLAFGEEPVDMLTAAMFEAGIDRLAAGEPLAYITGVKEFWSLPFSVAPGVLVPRPETELLVETCLARLGSGPRRVADLGTGSGAIALALAHERPQWELVATDRSGEALSIAAINARRLRINNVQFREGSWCAPLGDDRFDAIVSNPPYIAPFDPALPALRHEPLQALVAEDEGFADLLQIAQSARRHLLPGGLLLMEHGAGQSARLLEAMASMGYRDLASHHDLAGHDRVVQGVWS